MQDASVCIRYIRLYTLKYMLKNFDYISKMIISSFLMYFYVIQFCSTILKSPLVKIGNVAGSSPPGSPRENFPKVHTELHGSANAHRFARYAR